MVEKLKNQKYALISNLFALHNSDVEQIKHACKNKWAKQLTHT